MTSLSAANRESLKKISTATLTTVLFKRGLRNVFMQNIFLLNPKAPRMVGEAFTLRYIPAREDLDTLGAFEGRGHPQREAVEACPPGQVLVMDARRDASAATGGDILMARLMVRGVAGIVTDGGLRDSTTIEKMPWPAYCALPGRHRGGRRRRRGRHPGEDRQRSRGRSGFADRIRGLGRGKSKRRKLDIRAIPSESRDPRRVRGLEENQKGLIVGYHTTVPLEEGFVPC